MQISALTLLSTFGATLLAFGLGHAYWAALGLGGTVFVGSFLLSGIGDSGGGGDVDADADADSDSGADHSHSPGHGHASSSAPGFLSPMMVAFFLVCFGLIGLLTSQWQYQMGARSLIPAVGVGAVLSYLLRKGVGLIFSGATGGNEPRPGEEIGLQAEVINTIPADGPGAVAYIVRGIRYTRPARSATHEVHHIGDKVVITRSDRQGCMVAAGDHGK